MKNSWWKIAIVVALVIVVGVVIAGKNGKNEGSASSPSSASTAVSSDADKSPDTTATEDKASVGDSQSKPSQTEATTQPEQDRKTGQPSIQDKPAAVKKAPAKQPKLVDLGATKCIPCKMMAPILKELAKDFKGQLEVQFIDVWENAGAGEKYGIKVIPTQIFYDANGKEFFRHEGFFAREDILAKFKEQGIKLAE